jgi:serine/threonine protein kinase
MNQVTQVLSFKFRVPLLTCFLATAGQWRGLEVAIKVVIFSSAGADQYTQLVASEAAIASNLTHDNIVSTYSHDIVDVQKSSGPELGIYKFYLIQVCPGFSFHLC